MKLLMEQWRGFLNEKLMLNPGDKASICINTRVGGTYANDDSSCLCSGKVSEYERSSSCEGERV